MISAPDETATKPTETVETPSVPAVEETTAPVTTLPERPRETTQPPADNVEAIHAKRPYETPLFFKEEQKPPKMPKVEDAPAEAEAEVASASFGQSSVSQSRREEGVVVSYQFLTRRASRRAG